MVGGSSRTHPGLLLLRLLSGESFSLLSLLQLTARAQSPLLTRHRRRRQEAASKTGPRLTSC
eukprot:scaffold1237_cov403-Prasinococcus_capsulatus_cf.AAC.13